MASLRAEIRRLAQHGAPAFTSQVTVRSVREVSASYVRVRVHGEGLAAYRDVLPADAFKVALPPQPSMRAFTVRHFDPGRLEIEFDALRHDGLTSAWLSQVRPGDVVGLAGMRHDFYAGDDVTRHVIAGDASALPAAAAIIESLPGGTPGAAYLAVNDESDKKLLPHHDDIEVYWLADGWALASAVRANERPAGRIQAWFAAEAGVVRGLRRWALEGLGVAREDLHAAAYWKAGLDSTEVDAVNLGRYGEEVRRGADASDPDTRERVELGA